MKTTAQYDEHCVLCGYPFDRHESCHILSEDACHVYCATCIKKEQAEGVKHATT